MPDTPEARLARFPTRLRELIDAELAAGNTIVEIAGGHPAPPVGACVKLARPVTTRPRASASGLVFYDRNTSIYSGEWTDADRFFFVIEPPRPPPSEPDMNAIREASNRSAEETLRLQQREPPVPAPNPNEPHSDDRVRRVRSSMVIDYERWHDGIGYDLEVLNEATPDERAAIERLLLARGVQDWRDVEALAALRTDAADAALRVAFARAKAEIRGAVLHHAPHLVPLDKRKEHLIDALRTATLYDGLSAALDAVTDYHSPEVIEELLRGTLERRGEVAVLFAAMLMFVHGKANAPFDWSQRPFFLRFNTDMRRDRETAFRDLCKTIGVNAAKYLERG